MSKHIGKLIKVSAREQRTDRIGKVENKIKEVVAIVESGSSAIYIVDKRVTGVILWNWLDRNREWSFSVEQEETVEKTK